MQSKKISLYKTVTWRIIASLTTFLLAWAFTGEIGIGLAVGGSEVVLKMIFYYWHERAWEKYNPEDV